MLTNGKKHILVALGFACAVETVGYWSAYWASRLSTYLLSDVITTPFHFAFGVILSLSLEMKAILVYLRWAGYSVAHVIGVVRLGPLAFSVMLGLAIGWILSFRVIEIETLGLEEFNVNIITVSAFAVIVEEFLFRVVIYGSFRQSFGSLPSTIASSILFTAYHGFYSGSNHLYLPIFCVGIITATLYEKQQSIVGSMLFHSSYNMVAFASEFSVR